MVSEPRWLVKIRRHTGVESVVGSCDTNDGAQRMADRLNWDYQTDMFYVEQWSEEKQQWHSKTCR